MSNVPPGAVELKMIFANRASGKIGTLKIPLPDIPAAGRKKKGTMMRGAGLFVCLLLMAGIVMTAQDPPDAVFHSNSHLKQVSVIAQDKQGKPVADLRREEFQVVDNGSPQEIRLLLRTS